MDRNHHAVLIRSLTRSKEPGEFENGCEHVKSCPVCQADLNYWHKLLTDARQILIAKAKANPGLEDKVTRPPLFRRNEGVWWNKETSRVCCQLHLPDLRGQEVFLYFEGEGNDLLESGLFPWQPMKFRSFSVHNNGWVDAVIAETSLWTLVALIQFWREQNKIKIIATTRRLWGNDI